MVFQRINPPNPSAWAVLNKIALVDQDALGMIEKFMDEAIAKETSRKRNIADVFRSKAFWNGFMGGLAAPLIVLESYTSRRPRAFPSKYIPANEPDAVLWAAMGQYCAVRPDEAARADLTDGESRKLGLKVDAAPLPENGGMHVPALR